MEPIKILFVCNGNTCRSPMAESIMKFWLEENSLNWEVDSAGLKPWNIGRKPDARCIKVLEANHLKTKHYAKMVQAEDFNYYDFILAMDDHNIRELKRMASKYGRYVQQKIRLLGSYIGRPESEIIHDPYFCNGIDGFRYAFSQITEGCLNFIKAHE